MQGNALTWLGQAGFRLRLDGLEILIDPFTSDHEARLVPTPDLAEIATGIDWLLITHDHLDHFDDGFVSVLASYSPDASIVVPHPLVPKAKELAPELPVVGVGPGDSLQLAADVHLRCVPAWHAAEVGDGYSQGLDEDGACAFVGYIISTPEIALYHSGDTLVTDELRHVLAREQIALRSCPSTDAIISARRRGWSGTWTDAMQSSSQPNWGSRCWFRCTGICLPETRCIPGPSSTRPPRTPACRSWYPPVSSRFRFLASRMQHPSDLSPAALAGQVAIVTGGGRGVGLGIVQSLAQAGMSVAIVGRTEQRSNWRPKPQDRAACPHSRSQQT